MPVILGSGIFLSVVLVLGGFLYPLGNFLVKMGASWETLNSVFHSPAVFIAFKNSLILAFFASITGTLLGFLFSWLLWRFRFPIFLSRRLSTLLKLPYLLPPFFFAIGWIALAAPEVGYVNRLMIAFGGDSFVSIYSLSGAIWVMTLWSVALAMINLQPFFQQFPGALEDAALLCGASPWKTFFRITLKLGKGHLASCGVLLFMANLAAFGVPAMLAAPARSFVLTTRIFQVLRNGGVWDNMGEVSILVILLLCLVLFFVGLAKFFEHRSLIRLVTGKATRPSLLRAGPWEWLVLSFLTLFVLISTVLPTLAVVLQSLLSDRSDLTSWSLSRYHHVFFEIPNVLNVLGNSFSASLMATAVALILSVVIAYGNVRKNSQIFKRISGFLTIANSVPGTVIALALLIAFSGWITDTIFILSLAYLLHYMALSLRTVQVAMQGIGTELEEAAWMAGASHGRTFWRVIVPILFPAVFAAFILCLLPMVSELTMSVILAGAGTETLGVLIYRFQEYADPGSAAVLGTMMLTVTLIANGFVRVMSKGKFGI